MAYSRYWFVNCFSNYDSRPAAALSLMSLSFLAVLSKIQELGYYSWALVQTLDVCMFGSNEKHQAWIFRRNGT